MKVSEIMTSDVVIASPQDRLQHVTQLNCKTTTSASFRSGKRAVWSLSDRDITVRAGMSHFSRRR